MKKLLGAALLAMIAPSVSLGQEDLTINRREQARDAFLATPQGVYEHYCAHCHGEDGTGGGRLWASELSPPPTDLTALGEDRDYVIEVIRDGSAVHGKSNLCPPWGSTISATNIERLAQHVVSLGGERASEMREMPEMDAQPVRASFPWILLLVVLAEIALLWWILRKEASHALSKDSSVGG